jgi:hypothetical protein
VAVGALARAKAKEMLVLASALAAAAVPPMLYAPRIV